VTVTIRLCLINHHAKIKWAEGGGVADRRGQMEVSGQRHVPAA
jgi:hypothetical protein